MIKKLHALKINLIIFGYEINRPSNNNTSLYQINEHVGDSESDSHNKTISKFLRKKVKEKEDIKTLQPGLTDEDNQITMFINKIINFYEGSSHKNKEMWFGKDELRSEFDISSRH